MKCVYGPPREKRQMQEQALVTVLIPTFNRKKLVVDSLHKLSVDLEYLFLNGSESPYGINNILKNVKEIHHPGSPPDVRINLGLQSVKTPYVIMMSDDDLLIVESYDNFKSIINTAPAIFIPQTWYLKGQNQWILCSRQFLFKAMSMFRLNLTSALVKSGVVVWSAIFPTQLLRDELPNLLEMGRCDNKDQFVVKEVEYLMGVALCKSERPLKIINSLILLRDKSDKAKGLRKEYVFSESGWIRQVGALKAFLKNEESKSSDADSQALRMERKRISIAFKRKPGRSKDDFSRVLMEPRGGFLNKLILIHYHFCKFFMKSRRSSKFNSIWKLRDG